MFVKTALPSDTWSAVSADDSTGVALFCPSQKSVLERFERHDSVAKLWPCAAADGELRMLGAECRTRGCASSSKSFVLEAKS